MEGRRLFSFPNVAALPDIPVIAKGFAPSAECLELRQIKRELTASHLAQEQLGYEESNRRWAALWHRHDAVAQVLYDRPVRTWSQVSEFAEIAWLHAQKEEEEMGDPSWRYSVNTGRLARKTESNSNWRGWSSCSSATASYAALIEGVLTLTGGERYDPRVESFNRTYGSA
jgi:prolyl oligopeptidase PreP (S9A serine peptidase family)